MSPLQLPPERWIIEGLLTTLAAEDDGPANVAPMGPIVDADFRELILRPFQGSTTHRNLTRTGAGVFHVTDDVLLMARAAVGQVVATGAGDLKYQAAQQVRGVVLLGACRYYELRVTAVDDRQQRATIVAQVVASGRLRDFPGFNRARHAVLEAAILATRVHLTGAAAVLEELAKLQVLVDKTGSEREQQAMAELRAYLRQTAAAPSVQAEGASGGAADSASAGGPGGGGGG